MIYLDADFSELRLLRQVVHGIIEDITPEEYDNANPEANPVA